MHRFKLIERIGNGGYSQVFKALDNSTGKLCALKVMKHPYEGNRETQNKQLGVLKKFRGEGSFVQLLDYFFQEGFLIMVFQLMQRNLIDFYKTIRETENRSLTQTQIKNVLFRVSLALKALHREGYFHRDVKPQNILVQREAAQLNVKLMDFGLTKLHASDDNTEYIATRWYRAPEMLLRMPYNKGVDVFALGCVMLELYGGVEPFRGMNAMDQLHQICKYLGCPTKSQWPEGVQRMKDLQYNMEGYRYCRVAQLAPNICREGLNLVERMLKFNPKQRITIDDVVNHSYFSSLNCPTQTSVAKVIQNPQNLWKDRLMGAQTSSRTKSKIVAYNLQQKAKIAKSIKDCLNSHLSDFNIADFSTEKYRDVFHKQQPAKVEIRNSASPFERKMMELNTRYAVSDRKKDPAKVQIKVENPVFNSPAKNKLYMMVNNPVGIDLSTPLEGKMKKLDMTPSAAGKKCHSLEKSIKDNLKVGNFSNIEDLGSKTSKNMLSSDRLSVKIQPSIKRADLSTTPKKIVLQSNFSQSYKTLNHLTKSPIAKVQQLKMQNTAKSTNTNMYLSVKPDRPKSMIGNSTRTKVKTIVEGFRRNTIQLTRGVF